jgi:pyruvate,water dikinase
MVQHPLLSVRRFNFWPSEWVRIAPCAFNIDTTTRCFSVRRHRCRRAQRDKDVMVTVPVQQQPLPMPQPQPLADNLTGRQREQAIVWLDDLRCRAVERTGGKAAQLSKLAGVHEVPPGFVVTADAFRDLSVAGHVAPELRSALVEAYAELAAVIGEAQPAVAVRSSAIDEDGALASFAGQHETYLNVVGIDAIVAAVEACWASAQTEQALAYRRQQGLMLHAADDIRIAVLVQLLVPADVSAVAFSANPISGRTTEVMVTASWGLGESIVGGTVTPDHWVVDKQTGEIIEERAGSKLRMTIAVPGGTREVDVPRIMRDRLSLTAAELRQIGDLCDRLEAVTGRPVDVECAFRGRLYLLQCRPITTLGALDVLDGADELEPVA